MPRLVIASITAKVSPGEEVQSFSLEVQEDELKRYEEHLNAAVDLMIELKFPSPNLKFDSSHWESIGITYGGSPDLALVLKKGKKPSEAVDAMFSNISGWALDCARFIQVAHWYAMRHTLGDENFNKFISWFAEKQRTKVMALLPEGSTGILTERGGLDYYQRGSPLRQGIMLNANMEGHPLDEVLSKAPLGSCVSFVHLAARAGTAFRFENTLKLGPDLYAAHGYGKATNKFTRAEVEQYLDETVMESGEDKRYSDEEVEQAKDSLKADAVVNLYTVRYYDVERMSGAKD